MPLLSINLILAGCLRNGPEGKPDGTAVPTASEIRFVALSVVHMAIDEDNSLAGFLVLLFEGASMASLATPQGALRIRGFIISLFEFGIPIQQR